MAAASWTSRPIVSISVRIHIMRCAAQEAGGSLEGRSQSLQGWPTLRVLVLRLTLLAVLGLLSGRPWTLRQAHSTGAHSTGATRAGPVRLAERRLLQSEVRAVSWALSMPCMQERSEYAALPTAAAALHLSAANFASPHRALLQDPAVAPGPLTADPQMVTFRQAVLMPPNSTEEGGGSVLLPGLVPLGTVLAAAADNVQPSQGACCAACRADERCNVFWYCETEARRGGPMWQGGGLGLAAVLV